MHEVLKYQIPLGQAYDITLVQQYQETNLIQ